MAYVLFVTICAVWGSSFMLMKKAALAFNPATVGAGRVIGGALVLGAIWWWRGTRDPIRSRDLGPLLFVILLGYAWPYALQPHLVNAHGSALVGMTVGFVPLFTIFFSIPLLGVYPTPRQLWGVLGALACLGAMMLEGLNRQIPVTDLCLAVTVPLNYALANTWIRRSLRHLPSLALSFYTLAATSVILLPFACWLPSPAPPGSEKFYPATICLVLLGVVSTGFATLIFNKLIVDHGPLFAGMSTNLIPLGALIWGWVDHEHITPLQLGALFGLLTMVAVVQFGAPVPTIKSAALSPADSCPSPSLESPRIKQA